MTISQFAIGCSLGAALALASVPAMSAAVSGDTGASYSYSIMTDGVVNASITNQTVNADPNGDINWNGIPETHHGGADGGSIQIEDITGVYDPTLATGVAFVDGGAASTFSFSTSMFISPLSGVVDIDTFVIASLGDAGTGGVAMSLVGSAVATFAVNGVTQPAVELITAPVSFPAPGGTTGALTAMSTVDCSLLPGGFCTSLSVGIDFGGSGGGDAYSFVISNTVTDGGGGPTVSEPSALALLGLAGLGLAVARRRG